MRYYRIKIWETDKSFQRGKLIEAPSMKDLDGAKEYTYSSVDESDRVNHSALDVRLDLANYELGEARKGSAVHVYGISKEDIHKFAYTQNAEIEVSGGMLSDYLPLAHNVKPDILAHGTIRWATGNWEGVNTSLELILVPLVGRDPGDVKRPNFILTVTDGMKLSDAIRKALESAYGKTANATSGYELDIRLSDKMVWHGATFIEKYYNVSQFAADMRKKSLEKWPDIVTEWGVKYDGIAVKLTGRRLSVWDGTNGDNTKWTYKKPLEFPFTDLIGQPMWKTSQILSVKVVMRGDVEPADWIKLPEWLATPYVGSTGGEGQAPNDEGGLQMSSKQSAIFKGVFRVKSVRHVGQFRQADGNSWVTVIDCQPMKRDEAYEKSKEPLKPAEEPPTRPEPHKEGAGSPLQTSPTSPFKQPVPVNTTTLPAFSLFPPIFPPPTGGA